MVAYNHNLGYNKRMKTFKTCCCAGLYPKNFPFDYKNDKNSRKAFFKEMLQKVEFVVENYGVNRFITGMTGGAEHDFAEAVLYLRDTKNFKIFLECAVPCPAQKIFWNEFDRLRYENIFLKADLKYTLFERYTSDCFKNLAKYLVYTSDLVIAVYNGDKKGAGREVLDCAINEKKIIEYINLFKQQ